MFKFEHKAIARLLEQDKRMLVGFVALNQAFTLALGYLLAQKGPTSLIGIIIGAVCVTFGILRLLDNIRELEVRIAKDAEPIRLPVKPALKAVPQVQSNQG